MKHELFKPGIVKCKYKIYQYTIQYIKDDEIINEEIESHRIISAKEFRDYCNCEPLILDKKVENITKKIKTIKIETEGE